MTAHIFNIAMILLSLIGITTGLYIALARGVVVEFLYKAGQFIGAVAGAIFDIVHHLCMDVRDVFKSKVRLDEHEKNIS